MLTLYRGAKAIPNPRADRVLEAQDKLLCFGKLESMRGMVPVKSRRRRLPKVKELAPDEAARAISMRRHCLAAGLARPARHRESIATKSG